MVLKRAYHFVRERLAVARLPEPARIEAARDRERQPAPDPGIEPCVDAAIDWLARAQDMSATADGGVARHFSLVSGWGPSYPETTGYIVPTLLDCASARRSEALRQRARRMLDWLVSIQCPGGGFQGGTIDARPVVPVTFNTGQILMGLAAGVRAFGDEYRAPMTAAAQWLVTTQDPDGCWRKHPSPFASPGEKAYETHVAWGLLEAHTVEPHAGYADSARRNIDWALRKQRANGWFDSNCLEDAVRPYTHTIGYVLRGLVEGYRFFKEKALLSAALRTADGVLGAMQPDGFLAGRLDAEWRSAASWCCLTGNVQIAHCWLQLYEETGDTRYRDAAYAANAFVRRTVRVSGAPDLRGGIKGSLPVDGDYGRFEYLNWACKFFIDANLLERSVRSRES